MSMLVNFFVDPACLWSWLTSRWLVEVAPQRDLDLQWRTYSLLLRDGTQGLQDQLAAVRTGFPPGGAGDGGAAWPRPGRRCPLL
jgi:predicted DsbA family dithiol-disulfide isomerase